MKKRLIALCLALAFVLAALPGNLVSLAAEELADLGVQSNQGAANGEQSGGNASDGVVINNGVTGEVTDSEGNPVLDANGKPLQVVVGGDLPEGSTVQATDHSSTTSDENIGILDVKLNDGDGNKWQPAPGETVQVGVPVAADANRVTVVHFIEDPEIIKWALENGKAEKYDVSEFAEDENFGIIESAVKAYQTACNTTDLYVVVEQFDNVAVVNGVAVVDAQGFSVFTSVPPNDIVEDKNNFFDLPSTVYVRPDEWLSFTSSGALPTMDITRDNNGIAEKISGDNFQWIGTASIYFHVDPEAKKNQEFRVRGSAITWSGIKYHTVTFIVTDDFDYGNVYIGVVGPDTPYPNEISTHTNSNIYQYYTPAGLGNKDTYSMLPNGIIDINAVKSSNLTVMHDTKTVYGVADTTGAKVTPFLREGFDAIAADILAKYFASNPEQAENYRVVPYVVKHETIGANVGWYVNCKIELKDTYLLKYDYNFPEGFDEFDITEGAKPNDRTVSTQGAVNGVVNTNLDPYSTIKLSTKLVNPNTNQENPVEVELVGWALTPDADKNDVLAPNAVIEMHGNTTLYAVWKVTEGGWVYTKFNWTINNTVVNQQNMPIDSETVFAYTISASGAFPAKYKLYDKAGALVGERTFGANNSFTLADGQYIIIEGVAIDGTYTVTETLPVEGYACETPSYSVNTEAAKQNGKAVANFVNKLQMFTITFNPNNGEAEWTEDFYYGDTIVMPADPTRENYTFLGWDGEEHVTMPAKDLTYTAQWKLNVTSMTISKTGCDTIDVNQSFIFRVVGDDVDMLVAVQGNGQVTIGGLIVGKTYTVTQQNWSWRYEVVETSITLGETGNVVEMAGDRTNKQWLDGNHSEINVFDGDLTK